MTGTITGTGTTLTLASCTFGSATSPCFTNAIVAGDQITPSGNAAQTVTAVASSTQVTVSPGFTGASSSWSYKGFFINPVQDSQPPPDGTGYAGGGLTVTSNAGQNGLVWSITAAATSPLSTSTRTTGRLFAYSADPTNTGTLQLDYMSGVGFCVNPFPLPTVANGRIYLPTYLIGTSCPTSGAVNPSGILVYGPTQH